MILKTIQKLIIFSAIALILGGVVLISRDVRANNVCSYNASEEIGITDYYYNNIPVNPEKCSLCVGNHVGDCEGLSKEKCENSYHTNPYYLPGMMDFFLNQASEEDIYNDMYGFQCVWNDFDYPVSPDGYIWSGSRKVYFPEPGCLSYQFEYVETLDPPRDKLYYTYKPCNPPPSCQDKCQNGYNRDGACLERAERDYPEALKQDGQYRDCWSGTFCYCKNHKPVVESISLTIDPVYLDKFEDYDDGKITEYDPLICEAVIYDADAGDQAEGKIRAVILPRVNGERITGTLSTASCEFNPETKRHICTKKFRPKDIQITGSIRGKKLACEAIPYDAYQEGKSVISNEYTVARFNYYFIQLNPPEVTNYKEQYDLFTKLSAVDNTLKDTGKPLYLKESRSIKREDFRGYIGGATLEQLFYVGATGVILPKIDEFVRNMGLEWNPNQDRIVGMSDIREGFTGKKEDTVFINSKAQQVLAHELGHTYGLCDEYMWRTGLCGYSFQLPCDNDYPSCCIDSPANKLQKRLEEEKNKIFRDGIVFSQWIDANIASLTDEELLELRKDCPCAKIGGECVYSVTQPEEYALLREDPFEDYCPPQRKERMGSYFGNCYIKEEIARNYGNSCYNFSKLGSFELAQCAGMPLKKSDVIFIEDDTDLFLLYRSIMGYGNQPVGIYRYPSKAKYPLNPKK